MLIGFKAIDEYITFTANTHDPDSGSVADADSVPTYRIYEDETGTPILSGSMAKLDDSNTLGFYSERIQCTAANGFEVGKCYSIRKIATVTGSVSGVPVTGVQLDSLEIIDPIAASDIEDSVFDRAVEGSYTFEEICRGVAAFAMGKSTSGAGHRKYRDLADTKDRIDGTVSSGDRSAITLDLT